MDLEDLELKTGRVTTLNELAHNLMSAFILEIYFILLSFKAWLPIWKWIRASRLWRRAVGGIQSETFLMADFGVSGVHLSGYSTIVSVHMFQKLRLRLLLSFPFRFWVEFCGSRYRDLWLYSCRNMESELNSMHARVQIPAPSYRSYGIFVVVVVVVVETHCLLVSWIYPRRSDFDRK